MPDYSKAPARRLLQKRGRAEPSRPVPEQAQPAPVQASAPTPERTYTVADGDTLSGISKKMYGTASRWPEILEANKDQIRSEKSLPVGLTLKIP